MTVALQYLFERARNRLLVYQDLKAGVYAENADTGWLVDWSEVYSYIYSSPPNSQDPLLQLTRELGRESLARETQQVSLSLLFDRIPQQKVLVPPYEYELRLFLDMLRAHALELKADISSHAAQYLNVDLSTLESAPEMLRELAKDRNPEMVASKLDRIDDLELQRLIDFIGQNFGAYLLVARASTGNVLEGLRHLLAEGARPGNGGITTCPGAWAEIIDSSEGAIQPLPWANSTPNAHLGIHPGAKQRDAAALGQIQQLAATRALHGQATFFVSRDRWIGRVVDRWPGDFACFSAAYAQDRFEGVPATILRTPNYFFELAVALSGDTQEDQVLLAHRRQRQAQGEFFSHRASSGSKTSLKFMVDNTQQQLDTVKRYQEAYVGTTRPWLPNQKLTSDCAMIIRDFIRLITDPNRLKAVRESVAERLDLQLAELPLIESGSAIPEVKGGFVVLTASLARRLPLNALVPLVTSPGIKALHRRLMQKLSGRISAVGGNPEVLRKQLASNSKRRGQSPTDKLLLRTAWAFCAVGNPHSVVGMEDDWSTSPVTQRTVPHHVLGALMIADAYQSFGGTDNADNALRDCYGRISTLRAGNELWLIAILNAWLTHHLEVIEAIGEAQAGFPRGTFLGESSPDVTLKSILAKVLEIVTEPRTSEVLDKAKPLRDSIYNNLVYAAARLTPIYPGTGAQEIGVEEALVQHAAEVLSRRCRRPSTTWGSLWLAQYFDTLAYYYLKRAVVHRAAGQNEKADSLMEDARDHIQKSSKTAPEASAGNHVRRLIAAHKEGLDEGIRRAWMDDINIASQSKGVGA